MTGLKLQHRNLFVAAKDHNAADNTCRACDEEETQLHLCKCGVIRQEFWNTLLKLLTDLGMPFPENTTAFLATGAVSAEKAISTHLSGIWFIAWRCLYAEIANSRVEDRPLDLGKALKRVVAMTISRLRAYGYGWRTWCDSGRYRGTPNVIPRKHSNKAVLTQTPEGEYEISDVIWQLTSDLGMVT